MERYTAYNPLARIYSAHRGFYAKRCLPVLNRLVLGSLRPGAAILDLCCGVGDLAAHLAERGLVVTGLDGSDAMLEVARANVPNAAFILADARTFQINSQFDAVVSTFNSLNHMMAIDELQAVFGRVYQSVCPGGRFVFDLNLNDGFVDRWKGQTCEVTDHTALFTKMSFETTTQLARAEFTIFEENPDHRWSRQDVILTQRCYAPSIVLAALESAGFSNIGVEVQPPDSSLSGRGFFYGSRLPKA